MAQDTYIDEMTIYNPSGKAIYDAPVTTSAIIKYALMGDYYIELPFSLLTPLDFPLGSYTVSYTHLTLPTILLV